MKLYDRVLLLITKYEQPNKSVIFCTKAYALAIKDNVYKPVWKNKYIFLKEPNITKSTELFQASGPLPTNSTFGIGYKQLLFFNEKK